MARKAEVARRSQVKKTESKPKAKVKVVAKKVVPAPSKVKKIALGKVNDERANVIAECTEILRRLRLECLDLLRTELRPHGEELTGDEGDMSKLLEQRTTEHLFRDKTEQRLRDVQLALRRVEEGTYGVCEETGEDIELGRLKAIPWTRWSREGAEIRERMARQYSHRYYGDDEDGFSFEDVGQEEEAQA